MINFIEMLFGCFLAIALTAAGFAFMFSPELGKRILKRTAVSSGIIILAICILQSMFQAFKQRPVTFLLIAIPVIFFGYLIWQRSHPGRQRSLVRGAAERRPVLPQNYGDDDL